MTFEQSCGGGSALQLAWCNPPSQDSVVNICGLEFKLLSLQTFSNVRVKYTLSCLQASSHPNATQAKSRPDQRYHSTIRPEKTAVRLLSLVSFSGALQQCLKNKSRLSWCKGLCQKGRDHLIPPEIFSPCKGKKRGAVPCTARQSLAEASRAGIGEESGESFLEKPGAEAWPKNGKG